MHYNNTYYRTIKTIKMKAAKVSYVYLSMALSLMIKILNVKLMIMREYQDTRTF